MKQTCLEKPLQKIYQIYWEVLATCSSVAEAITTLHRHWSKDDVPEDMVVLADKDCRVVVSWAQLQGESAEPLLVVKGIEITDDSPFYIQTNVPPRVEVDRTEHENVIHFYCQDSHWPFDVVVRHFGDAAVHFEPPFQEMSRIEVERLLAFYRQDTLTGLCNPVAPRMLIDMLRAYYGISYNKAFDKFQTYGVEGYPLKADEVLYQLALIMSISGSHFPFRALIDGGYELRPVAQAIFPMPGSGSGLVFWNTRPDLLEVVGLGEWRCLHFDHPERRYTLHRGLAHFALDLYYGKYKTVDWPKI